MNSSKKKYNISVSEKNCKRCGYCIEFCPVGVFGSSRDGFPVIQYLDKCTGCRQCVFRCPDFAVVLEVIE